MGIQPHDRKYDLIVYGATGYTGKLISEHITQQLPTNLRWAIAGRSRPKLIALAADLRRLDADRMPPIIEAVTADTLPALTAETRVLIAAVGPFLIHGEAAFAACVRAGTRYIDVSGETPFLGRMIAKYDDEAKETGCIAISQAGVDSVPADVLTWAVAKHAAELCGGDSANLGHVSFSMTLSDSFSGGTFASVLEMLGGVPLAELRATHAPFALSPVPNPHPARDPYPLPKLLGVREIPHLGLQSKSAFGATDAVVVWRSWGLMELLKAKPPHGESNHRHISYGPKFSFAETQRVTSYPAGVLYYFGFVVTGFLLTVSSLFRGLARRVAPKPGSGRMGEDMKRGSGTFTAIGEIADGPRRGTKIRAQARYTGSSAYQWTGAFVAEAAMVLLEDEELLPAGILTTACLGQAYVDRLRAVGFDINVGELA